MGSHHGPLVVACWYQRHRQRFHPLPYGPNRPGGGECQDGRDPHPHWRTKGIWVVPLYPFSSTSRAADAAAGPTPSMKGTITRAADLEDNVTTKEACRSTSSVSILPAPDNDKDTWQSVLSRTNGIFGPNPLLPALSLPPPPTAAATTMASNAHRLNGGVAAHAGQYRRAQPPGKVFRERDSCCVPAPAPN